jgi:hypothetical protein
VIPSQVFPDSVCFLRLITISSNNLPVPISLIKKSKKKTKTNGNNILEWPLKKKKKGVVFL